MEDTAMLLSPREKEMIDLSNGLEIPKNIERVK